MVELLGRYLRDGSDVFGGGFGEKEGSPRMFALGAASSSGGTDGSGGACEIDEQMLHNVHHMAEFVAGVTIPLWGHHLAMAARSILL